MAKITQEVMIGGVCFTLRPKMVPSYMRAGKTAQKAAELLIGKGTGASYVDSMPNRVRLLEAGSGNGLRKVEEVLGISTEKKAQEIPGVVERAPAGIVAGEQIGPFPPAKMKKHD